MEIKKNNYNSYKKFNPNNNYNSFNYNEKYNDKNNNIYQNYNYYKNNKNVTNNIYNNLNNNNNNYYYSLKNYDKNNMIRKIFIEKPVSSLEDDVFFSRVDSINSDYNNKNYDDNYFSKNNKKNDDNNTNNNNNKYDIINNKLIYFNNKNDNGDKKYKLVPQDIPITILSPKILAGNGGEKNLKSHYIEKMKSLSSSFYGNEDEDEDEKENFERHLKSIRKKFDEKEKEKEKEKESGEDNNQKKEKLEIEEKNKKKKVSFSNKFVQDFFEEDEAEVIESDSYNQTSKPPKPKMPVKSSLKTRKVKILSVSSPVLSSQTKTSFQPLKVPKDHVQKEKGYAVFKAYVDLSDFKLNFTDVKIYPDDINDLNLIVEAKEDCKAISHPKHLRQKVRIPRFADIFALEWSIDTLGIVQIEVPMLYFSNELDEQEKKKFSGTETISFINHVKRVTSKNTPENRQEIEIIVIPGQYSIVDDINVKLNNKILTITELKRTYRVNECHQEEKMKNKTRRFFRIVKLYRVPEKAIKKEIKCFKEGEEILKICIPVLC